MVPRSLTVLVYLGFVLAFSYTFPYWAALKNPNEIPRVAMTLEIVEHGTFRLDDLWDQLSTGSTFDISITPDGHKFPNKAPGTSFVSVPAYLAVKAYHRVFGGKQTLTEIMWACRFTASLLPALLFLPLFRRTARRFASDAAADAALIALAFGSMMFPYAELLFSHTLAAACAGGAFALAVDLVRGEARRPLVTGLGVGFLLGWAEMSDYQSMIALLCIVGYVAVRQLRALPAVLAGGLPPAILLGYYHWSCYGAPWRTGYSFAADPAHQQGFLGLVGPSSEAMAQALITVDNGLLVLMPWAALAIAGGLILWRRRVWRAEAIACAVIAIGYVLFVGSLVPEFGRAGWSIGPRYICVAMPFFAWLAAAALDALDRWALVRAAAHALILAGVVVMVVAGTTLPYWPTEIRNPLYEVGFWALGNGYTAPSLGTLLGLHGIAAILPLYAVIAVICFVLLGRGQRGRMATMLAAAVLAALWIWAIGLAPRTFDLPTQRDYLSRLWVRGAKF